MSDSFWLAEGPPLGGVPLYAPPHRPLHEATDPRKAMRFASQEECAAWCAANPEPAYRPVEHGFEEPIR